METFNISNVLMLILLAGLPIFLMLRAGKGKEKALIKKFEKLGHVHNLNIEGIELWKHKIFGVDHQKQKMLFYNDKDKGEAQLIDLKEVQSCRLEIPTETFTTKTKGGIANTFSEVLAVKLILISDKASNKNRELVFYDYNKDFTSDQKSYEYMARKAEGMIRQKK